MSYWYDFKSSIMTYLLIVNNFTVNVWSPEPHPPCLIVTTLELYILFLKLIFEINRHQAVCVA